ncbi:hypothetical protein ACFL3H_01780 [Gemmatimonadota bacterium]
MVRLRQRERFRATRKDPDPELADEDAAGAPRIAFRRATPVGDKRIRPRSVVFMVALFIIVLMAIILLG